MIDTAHRLHGYKRAALASLDRLLDEKPEELDAGLIAAVGCVVQLRDDLIACARRGDGGPQVREELRQANTMISLLVGTHYPLVGVQWERLKTARDTLAQFIGD